MVAAARCRVPIGAVQERLGFQAGQEADQRILDGVFEEYSGQPVGMIKPVLVERWAAGNDDATISDPELTNIAQAISDGVRAVLTGDISAM